MLSPTKSTVPVVPPGVDEVFYALHLLRRRRLDDCIKLSAHLLSSSRVTSPSHPHARNASAAASSSSSAPTSEEQLWYAQTKALVMQNWYDDTELEEDGVDQVLMEGEQAVVSALHKPNTSLTAAAGTKTGARRTAGGGGVSRAAGLGTASARPMSSRYGFARPGSVAQRPGSASRGPGGTAGHHRPITGRLTRLGTASLQAIPGGPHIQLQRLDVGKYARTKPMVAKLLCDYLLYVEHQPKMAMELCRAARQPQPAAVAPTHPPAAAVMPSLTGPKSAASAMPSSPTTPAPPTTTPTAPALPPMMPTVQLQVGIHNEDDAWWRQRLGKSCYQLGLLREAEMHLKAALYDQPRHGRSFTNGGAATSASMEFANYDTSTIIELGKVYAKLDQPLTALDLYNAALRHNPIDHHVLLCCARLRDELHEPEEAFELYTQVLRLESSNVEAIACVAAYFLYGRNQPELSLRYYRRLLQMGMNTTEVWNNLGLCAFLTSQLDYALSCFERALNLCQQDAQRADVWYNIGHIGVGLGDHRFAQQAFRLAVAADATHAEATNNLAVLALGPTADDVDGSAEGRRLLQLALSAAPELVEALYNSAVVAYRAGELEEAFSTTNRVLDCAPEQAEAAVLHDRLQRVFAAL